MVRLHRGKFLKNIFIFGKFFELRTREKHFWKIFLEKKIFEIRIKTKTKIFYFRNSKLQTFMNQIDCG